MMDKTYLGDGLYVSFDGYSFTLSAPRGFGEHYVVLEPEVLDEFLRYVYDIRNKIKEGK